MSVNNQLIQSIQSCVSPKYQSVTVALSGGVDSVVMLHACVQLRAQMMAQIQSVSFTVKAVHIHHGLSPNADNWLAFCKDLCEKHEVEFTFLKVGVNQQSRKSLEELARNARYAAIDELASPDSLVLVAQHEDDQAETVLLQLKRGAGPKGLSGMARQFTKSSSVEYARPWIAAGIGKQDVLDYAQQHQLTWVEDESNNDQAFERNFLRNEVLPILKGKWPQITKTISRSANLCAIQNELVESLAKEALHKIIDAAGSLSIIGLQALPHSLAAEVLRMWTTIQSSLTPSLAQLNEIQKLCEAKADQVGVVQIRGWQCRCFNQYLYWVENSSVVTKPYQSFKIDVKELDEGGITRENLTIGLLNPSAKEAEQSDCVLTIAAEVHDINVTFGDLQRKVKMYGKRPTKTIKAWMKEWKIKPWRRMAVPILMINDEVFAIVTEETINICYLYKESEAYPHPLKLAISLI